MHRIASFFAVVFILYSGESFGQNASSPVRGGASLSMNNHSESEQVRSAEIGGLPRSHLQQPTLATNLSNTAPNQPTAMNSRTESRGLALKKPSRMAGEFEAESSGSQGRSSSLIGTLFSLGIVVGLFLACAALAQRYMIGKKEPPLPSEVIQVLGSISLPTQPKQQAVLLKLGQRVLLLSNQSGQTRTLAEITDPTEVSQLIEQCKRA